MAQTNERIRQILSSQATYQERFIIAALEYLIGEDQTNAIIDSFLPVSADQQQVLFGRKLGEYNGLSRTQIKSIFNLNDTQVDEIFAAMGVVSGTSMAGEGEAGTEAAVTEDVDIPQGSPAPEEESKPKARQPKNKGGK